MTVRYEVSPSTREQFELRSDCFPLHGAIDELAVAIASGVANLPLDRATSIASQFALEVYCRVVSTPAATEGPVERELAWARTLLDHLEASPSFDGLRDTVSGDFDLGAIVLASLISALVENIENDSEKEDEDEDSEDEDDEDDDEEDDSDDAEEDDGDDAPTVGFGGPGDLDGQSPGPRASLTESMAQILADDLDSKEDPSLSFGDLEQPDARIESVLKIAIEVSVEEASREVSGRSAQLNVVMLGTGSRPDKVGDPSDTSRLEALEALDRNPDVAEAIDQLGRLLRDVRSRHDAVSSSARMRVVGVHRGDDFSLVLPDELVKLKHPLMRRAFLRDVLDGGVPVLEYEGDQKTSRGDVVVLIDESGSMHGKPALFAHAAACAVLHHVGKARRKAHVIAFDSRVVGRWRFDGRRGVAYSGTGAPLPSPAALVNELIGRNSGGGTEYAAPFVEGLDIVAKGSNADLLLITDGNAERIPDPIMSRLDLLRKKVGLRVFAWTMNGGRASRALQAMCDEILDIESLQDEDLATSSIFDAS